MKKLMVMLSLVLLVGVLGLAGCSGEEEIVEDDPITETEDQGQEEEIIDEEDAPVEIELPVQSARDALDMVVGYLLKEDAEHAPASGLAWIESDQTPEQLVGSSTRVFTAGDWTVEIAYPIVGPENMIFDVAVNGGLSGWTWHGTVTAQGDVTTTQPFATITEESSLAIAEEFVKNSPTFVFDGMEDTLAYTKTVTIKCPYCWLFYFTFDSRHGGYGDRTDMMVTQVITTHEAAVTVIQGKVQSAILDGQWDILEQEMIEAGGETTDEVVEKGIGYETVGALLADSSYEVPVSVEGTVSLMGELLCPCFELTSGGESVHVWYGLMVENDGTEMAEVDVSGIENGDTVIVTGMLKGPGGTHYSEGDFWAEIITPVVQD